MQARSQLCPTRPAGVRPSPPRPRVRRGGAVIEAVLIMPLLVMLSFGAIEYGFAFYVKHSIAAAAYVGARAAVATGSTNATVQAAVAASMTATGIPAGQYTLVTSPASVNGVATGTYVTVTVSCLWGTVGVSPLPVAMGGLPPNKTLSASTLMAHE